MSKYSDIDLNKVSYLIEVQGYNNKQLIEHFGINQATFYKWKKEKSEFSDTIKKSRIKLVKEITNNLIDRTRPKEYEETTIITKEIDGKSVTITKTVKKYIPASDTAIIFALYNLDPENWKRKDKEVINKDIDFTNIHKASDQEILEALKLMN